MNNKNSNKNKQVLPDSIPEADANEPEELELDTVEELVAPVPISSPVYVYVAKKDRTVSAFGSTQFLVAGRKISTFLALHLLKQGDKGISKVLQEDYDS